MKRGTQSWGNGGTHRGLVSDVPPAVTSEQLQAMGENGLHHGHGLARPPLRVDCERDEPSMWPLDVTLLFHVFPLVLGRSHWPT